MLLTLDLGNTSASIGLFKNGQMVKKGRFFYNDIPKMINNFIKSGGYTVENSIFCSVNPKNESKIRVILKHISSNRVIQLNNEDIPISNKYRNKNQAGVDRLVNVYGAGNRYGFPCLVIDIGTAITFDLGGPGHGFEGGLILPGPELWVNSLQKGTARIGQFPVSFTAKTNLAGRSTKECVESALILGYRAMFRDLIQQFRDYSQKKWKKKLKVILTGGNLKPVKPDLSEVDYVDEFLTLKSLAELAGQMEAL